MEPEESGRKERENGDGNFTGDSTSGHQIIAETEDKRPDGEHPDGPVHGIPETVRGLPETEATLQEPGSKDGSDTKPAADHPVIGIKRKTELQGMVTKSSLYDPAQIRRRTERDLKDAGSEIPYARTEKAVRDLVCSLIERQDRMNRDIFLEINTLQEDIGILKDQVFKLKTMKNSPAPGSKK